MGMCSRQERIQKDVDIVIQKCKAEKDCLFSDFRYTDATFTFTYSKGSRRYSTTFRDDSFCILLGHGLPTGCPDVVLCSSVGRARRL
ncbi:unnamed protein product [Coregonus sp. 'balchen']|nr:unnamed protein product [Coregonus sp. 'balchen']